MKGQTMAYACHKCGKLHTDLDASGYCCYKPTEKRIPLFVFHYVDSYVIQRVFVVNALNPSEAISYVKQQLEKNNQPVISLVCQPIFENNNLDAFFLRQSSIGGICFQHELKTEQ